MEDAGFDAALSDVAGHDGIAEEEARAWAAEQRQLGGRGEFFFACTQFCFSAVRGG